MFPKNVSAFCLLLTNCAVFRYVFGITHVPRLEDWPVMPVEHIGFMLMVITWFIVFMDLFSELLINLLFAYSFELLDMVLCCSCFLKCLSAKSQGALNGTRVSRIVELSLLLRTMFSRPHLLLQTTTDHNMMNFFHLIFLSKFFFLGD